VQVSDPFCPVLCVNMLPQSMLSLCEVVVPFSELVLLPCLCFVQDNCTAELKYKVMVNSSSPADTDSGIQGSEAGGQGRMLRNIAPDSTTVPASPEELADTSKKLEDRIRNFQQSVEKNPELVCQYLPDACTRLREETGFDSVGGCKGAPEMCFCELHPEGEGCKPDPVPPPSGHSGPPAWIAAPIVIGGLAVIGLAVGLGVYCCCRNCCSSCCAKNKGPKPQPISPHPHMSGKQGAGHIAMTPPHHHHAGKSSTSASAYAGPPHHTMVDVQKLKDQGHSAALGGHQAAHGASAHAQPPLKRNKLLDGAKEHAAPGGGGLYC
jgi:hypothetical protein